MIFYKLQSYHTVARFLADKIAANLSRGKSVLWLVPGGSATDAVVETSKLLAGNDLANLVVTLTDERFGETGHPDSNARQLRDMGLALPGAKFIHVLKGQDVETTTSEFAAELEKSLAASTFKIGFFGIGADGHTAGIKPKSAALTAQRLAEHFIGEDFERITVTPKLIAALDEAVVYAVGAEKQSQLDKLTKDLDIAEQPAQVLKGASSLTIFNDYKGEEYESR